MENESAVEHAGERYSLVGHRVGHRLQDGAEGGLPDFFGDKRNRGVGSHAAGVGPPVVVERTFMVSCDRQRIQLAAVHQTHEREFRSVKELLDHHASLSETFVKEHVAKGILRLAVGEGYNHSLSRCESVVFDHNRHRSRLDVCKSFVKVGEGAVRSGQYAVAAHQVFGEFLAALDARCAFGGTEYPQSLLAEPVHDSGGKGTLRPHYCKVYFLLPGECKKRVDVRYGYRHAFRLSRDSRVAGSRVDFLHLGRARESVHDGVASSSPSCHKNFLSHRISA